MHHFHWRIGKHNVTKRKFSAFDTCPNILDSLITINLEKNPN